jgi:hypothetical protein
MFRPGLWRLCASLALSFVLLQSTLAAPPQAAASNPQAVTFLQRSLAALASNTSITDVILTGTARRIAGSDDETGTVAFKGITGGIARLDFSFPSGTRSEVRSVTAAGTVGKWAGPDGVSHPIADHNLWTDWAWFPTLTVSNLLAKQDVLSVAYVGQETRGEQTVIHITATQVFPKLASDAASLLQRLSQTEIFLDSASLLPWGVVVITHPDNDQTVDIPLEFRFSDYRLTNGVQVPFHVQKFLNNGLVLDLQFQTVAINSGLSASEFSIQ